MTTSNDMTLTDAFDSVSLTPGAASHFLQWLSQQVGTDTEVGAALRDGGIAVGAGESPKKEEAHKPVSSTSTRSSTSA